MASRSSSYEFNFFTEGIREYPKSANVIEGFPKHPASNQDVPPTDMTNSEFFISNVESVEG